ncbi:hypothetical protein [Ktedonobacter racemifer]|nr:hypothetical protein [Ktedonobacter racemifer]
MDNTLHMPLPDGRSIDLTPEQALDARYLARSLYARSARGTRYLARAPVPSLPQPRPPTP